MRQLASQDSNGIQGNDHLAWNPARKKIESMKQSNPRRRTNPHIATGTNEKKRNRKEANNTVNKQAYSWHDAQPSMMHGMARGEAKLTTYLDNFKWGRKQHIVFPKRPHMQINASSKI
jgi:hypothetical protein